ncbi:MAG TPA: 3D domain-containing protein [Pyrinomonadaceae bacterium]|nr:3D domain-containing protein [Pyrinomonadaceae bacterium]
MKVKTIFNGSAFFSIALLSGSLFPSAFKLSAETLPPQIQQNQKEIQVSPKVTVAASSSEASSEEALASNVSPAIEKEEFEVPPSLYLATAYSLKGRTASGKPVSRGMIAADPRVLPLGSRVKLEAGDWSGEYLVADTGGMVRGRRIDIWTASSREAMRFGKRHVKLTVLSLGGKKRASHSAKK